ncbi:EXS-domain-containing protein [Panus rudis PR-1116 ss-1]|nr:EXS-domain-containing protein [Panus rudis PR-1116 ss-1]
MNHHVAEEITFSAYFPLPYRAYVLAGLGILAWATNLHGLHILGLDAATTLELNSSRNRDHSGGRPTSPLPGPGGWKQVSPPRSTYGPVYRLSLQYFAFVGTSWLLYRYAMGGDLALVDVFKYIPAVTGLLLFMLLICPFNVVEKAERDRFLYAVHRCIFSPRNHRVYFSDVVFADIFTSFAKVIGDVWLSFCMLLPGGSLLAQPAQTGLSRWILPTLMSIPYAVRFRQCIIEYMLPYNESKRPMYNALKYATSFPVIFLSAAQRSVMTDASMQGNQVAHLEGHLLFRLWLLFAAVNSLYSFWWDVTHDWGLDLLRPRAASANSQKRSRSPPKRLVLPHLHSRTALLHQPPSDIVPDEGHPYEHTVMNASTYGQIQYPWGLRPTLLFPLALYPFAIVADLILRMTWSAKLSSHLHSSSESATFIFSLELAEILRRWMWVFIRVEWEILKEPLGRARASLEDHPHIDHDRVPQDSLSERWTSEDAPGESFEMISSVRSESASEVG